MMENEDDQSFHVPLLTKSLSQVSQEEDISWYHGKITRDCAEHILVSSGGQEGCFLVRESSSSPGDYVLSLIQHMKPVHYQIRRHGEDAFFSIDEGPIMHGLEMLILHYQEHSHGLPTKLGPMCKGQPPPPDTRLHGRTNLLHRATKEGNLTVLKELLKSGYHSLDAKNQEGQSAVHLASIMGHDDILTMLLQAGASSNIRDSGGLTPLHYACRLNHPSTAKVLLELGGADLQIHAAYNDWVALHECANRGHLEAMKILLEHHAPCYPRSDCDETPYDLAMRNDHHNCAQLLRSFTPTKPSSSRSDWFHGNIDRDHALRIFQDADLQDGLFLIRKSSRKQGVYVLSMVYSSQIYNFVIQRKGKYFFIDGGPYLESLEHVVDHYSRFADGLPTCLVIPVKPEKPENQDVNNVPSEVLISNNNSLPKRALFSADYEACSIPNLIRRESLKLGPTIGEGEFGSVLKGTWTSPKQIQLEVAVKTLRDEHVQSCREEFIREVEVMVGLDHYCVIHLLGVCLGPPLMMVQELVPMGSLLDFLLDCPEQVNVDHDLKLWATQIACGMKYLESKRFVHRDLAARNILLASKQQTKISDFGLSRALGTDSEYYKATTGGRWPVKWYAPESINFGNFSHASDVWSYGVTLWEMYTIGQQPYGEMTGSQVIQLIEADKRLCQPELCPDKVYTVMMHCWEYQPEKRPTFSQLYHNFCTDTFFSSVWEYTEEL